METLIDLILAERGPKVKIIIFSRHGDKTPDNHITSECLQEIISNGMPHLDSRINVLQHGSALPRTEETALAAAIWITRNGGTITKHLPADERLGSDRMFQELYTEEIKKKMKTYGYKNYEALVEGNIGGLMVFEVEVGEAVYTMFDNMTPGDIALSANHSPTVEAAFNYFSTPENGDIKMSIASLDGIIIAQDEEEKIFIYR
jgi:hypothetical protein